MKKLFRPLLCACLLVGVLSIPSLAAETDVMPISAPVQVQGDFSVMINGEYATFTDATPKLKDGRSFLPFVAVFEQLGFTQEDMTWDGETNTVTATKDKMTIALTIGKTQISLTQGDKTDTITTDVAPYVDDTLARTYIPFGLVADALGYSVGWDAQKGVVIIDDVDAILAANEEVYTLMDKYMAYSKTFTQGNQKVAGNYAMNMDMDLSTQGQRTGMAFDVTGKYDMLMAGQDTMQFKTDMTMDAAMTQDGVDITDTTLGENAAMFPMTIDMDMRGSLSDGMFYFQSAALAQMMEQPGMASAWYKMDLKALFDQMSELTGMNYAQLMQLATTSQDMSFEQLLSVILRDMPLASADMTTGDYLAMFNLILGDSHFVKSGSTYVNTMEQNGMNMTFTLYTSGSKVNGYAMDLTAADPAFGEFVVTMSMRSNKMTMTLGMDMSSETQGVATDISLSMEMDGTYQSTTTKPVATPPADATIIDMMELMGSMAA